VPPQSFQILDCQIFDRAVCEPVFEAKADVLGPLA
jgi:hypothetical protein